MDDNLIISDTSYLRIWVSTEIPIFKPDIGMRQLDYKNRRILEYTSNGWKTLYSNQTCMRLAEIPIMDQGYYKFI